MEKAPFNAKDIFPNTFFLRVLSFSLFHEQTNYTVFCGRRPKRRENPAAAAAAARPSKRVSYYRRRKWNHGKPPNTLWGSSISLFSLSFCLFVCVA
jgi:hypothetical protein